MSPNEVTPLTPEPRTPEQEAREWLQSQPRCIGYPKCDGDLTAMNHSEACQFSGRHDLAGMSREPLLTLLAAYARHHSAELEADNARLRAERDEVQRSLERSQDREIEMGKYLATAERQLQECREALEKITQLHGEQARVGSDGERSMDVYSLARAALASTHGAPTIKEALRSAAKK